MRFGGINSLRECETKQAHFPNCATASQKTETKTVKDSRIVIKARRIHMYACVPTNLITCGQLTENVWSSHFLPVFIYSKHFRKVSERVSDGFITRRLHKLQTQFLSLQFSLAHIFIIFFFEPPSLRCTLLVKPGVSQCGVEEEFCQRNRNTRHKRSCMEAGTSENRIVREFAGFHLPWTSLWSSEFASLVRSGIRYFHWSLQVRKMKSLVPHWFPVWTVAVFLLDICSHQILRT